MKHQYNHGSSRQTLRALLGESIKAYLPSGGSMTDAVKDKFKQEAKEYAEGLLNKKLSDLSKKKWSKTRTWDGVIGRIAEALQKSKYLTKLLHTILDGKTISTSLVKDIVMLSMMQLAVDTSYCSPVQPGGAYVQTSMPLVRNWCTGFRAIIEPSAATTAWLINQPTLKKEAYSGKDTNVKYPERLIIGWAKCEGQTELGWKRSIAPFDLTMFETDKNKGLVRCEPGIKKSCQAVATWEYVQCGTCCCPGGSGFRQSFKMMMGSAYFDEEGELQTRDDGMGTGKSGCAVWFNTIETLLGTMTSLYAKLEAVPSWLKRCAHF